MKFRDCHRTFLTFKPPSLLVSQIAPTAANFAGRPRLLLPGRTCFVASARTGYAIRPFQAIDGERTFTFPDLRSCRLLQGPMFMNRAPEPMHQGFVFDPDDHKVHGQGSVRCEPATRNSEAWGLTLAPAPVWQRWPPRFALERAEQTAQNSKQRADSVPECAGPQRSTNSSSSSPPQPGDAAFCLCTKTWFPDPDDARLLDELKPLFFVVYGCIPANSSNVHALITEGYVLAPRP